MNVCLKTAVTATAALIWVSGVLVGAGCAKKTVDVNSPEVRGVGYVRLDDVVRRHPLYGQLAQLDSDIDALNMKALGPGPAKSGADIARETAELNRELNDARNNTNRILKQKQTDYAQRENAAMRAALSASGESLPNGSQIASNVQSTYQTQAAQVSAQAQRDLTSYQQSLVAQDRAAVSALSKSLELRADRRYRAKTEELSANESAYSLELASRDSAQRLSLRTKLSNLALDDATRNDTKAKLAALHQSEADAVAMRRNRDAATLSALQIQLRAQTAVDLRNRVSAIHAQTAAKLQARQSAARSEVASQIARVLPLPANPPAASAGVSPATRARLAQIDKQYKTQFQSDVHSTVANFNKTRDDLQRRFNELHGVDAASAVSTGKQLGQLRRQREQLYGSMVGQIKREVNTMAAARGLKIVFMNIVAPVGGVDLTDDAQKDIESLHE
ncbi:MAG: hypothetical protein M3Z14_07615 [Candidatus Eremiobacteraeota bacterium]|nr:hypothetical protein [Candidatus Eremiobacteraeota bacterium]